MKKTFFRMLPFVAAAVLAASCGKDGDSDDNINAPEPVVTPDPTQTPVGDGFVEIPFSIKVNDGNSLSKVALDGTTKSINFEESDVWNDDEKTGVQLTVTGDGVSGTLNLVNVGGYKFDGKLSVEKGKQGAFSTGEGIDLVGTFKLNESSTTTSSTESFKDLWDKCSHKFKAEFKSTASSLTLVDQNIYFYVATCKNTISINGSSVVAEKGFTKGSYYAYEYATTTVTGFAAGKTIAPSKLYTIGEYIDLGVEVGGKKILFANDNTYDSKQWSNLSEDELKLLPTKEEWKALYEQCKWTWDNTEGHNGYTVSSKTTSESIFLPFSPGRSLGIYWSSTEDEGRAGGAYCLYFSSYLVNPENYNGKASTWSVRTVRRSN